MEILYIRLDVYGVGQVKSRMRDTTLLDVQRNDVGRSQGPSVIEEIRNYFRPETELIADRCLIARKSEEPFIMEQANDGS